ncbi:MAG: stage III sporulation protein AF [Lachnospiraceae bacterium]|nr:stage III sporulation protein AF [Lachnospiraceae bacterium]
MNRVLDWVRQIAVFYILMTVVQHLLPAQKYRKYIRLYLGVVFILLVISPVFSIVGLSESLAEAMEEVQGQMAREDLRLEAKTGNEARYQMILTEYRGVIQERVTQMAGQEGYFLRSLSVVFEEDTDSPDFGRILSLDIVLSGRGLSSSEIYIEPIETGEEPWQEDGEAHPIMKKIRADLAEEYEVPQEVISVRRQEE